jgi:hypothetical protein
MKVYKAGSTPAEMNAWAASSGIFRTKGGKYMAARLIDQKNSNVAFMGYMYGDEEKKLNRFWKSIEFRVNTPVALVDRR